MEVNGMTNVNEQQLQLVESTLTTALLAWSATSVAVGTIVALVGRKAQNDDLVGFGRQTAAWGAVDALIAGAGVLSRRRRGPLSDEEAAKKAGSLRKLLLVNAVADVGYMAGGLLLIARGDGGQRKLRMGAGDGAAVVVQGAFLLVLDLTQAQRVR
jgi:hypothetical protein